MDQKFISVARSEDDGLKEPSLSVEAEPEFLGEVSAGFFKRLNPQWPNCRLERVRVGNAVFPG